ncbi:protein white-like [Planococcus citri]|uniref:protein white-like n=1 Tax=Planococcus citri TaxID=170843 RepID=UPI0031FA302D
MAKENDGFDSNESLPLLGSSTATATATVTGAPINYQTLAGNDVAGTVAVTVGNGTGARADAQSATNGRIKVNVFPEKNITYTWCDINVFTSKSTESRKRTSTSSKIVKIFKSIGCCRNTNNISKRKHILQNVSGVAYPGELLAIMGSSGAGKTTLLNTLTFRSSANMVVSGSRTVNDIPINSTTLSSLSAYVQQDDLFFGNLTVREHLIFQALVRMDRDIPYQQRMIRVEEVISELLLTSCQNTIIGKPGKIKGISGGEMKRLSFASEVLTNPPVMFCDEPTSGLDSFMAQTVVTVLKSMAMKGRTIICTIHQPSSEVYAMFDKILLMAEGRVAFLGSPTEANSFFTSLGSPCPANHNPADFFIQLLAVVPSQEEECRDKIQKICDSYENSEYAQKLYKECSHQRENKYKSIYTNGWLDTSNVAKRSPYKASWLAQFNAVMWRSWLSMKKEPILIRVRLLQTIMVSLIISVIYYGQKIDQDGVMNINGALFLLVTNMTFQNALAVINVFCSELPVFLREHFNGMYRTDVYFLCKTIAEIPIFLVIPIMFTCIVYYVIGLNPSFVHFITCVLIVVLVSTAATSFGYLVSCASPTVTVALSIGPPLIIPFLLFGGFFLNVGSIPPYFEWLSYLSWFKYGTEALYINQWNDIYNITCEGSNTTCYKNGHVVLEAYNFKEWHLLPDMGLLVLLIIGFRGFAFLGLLYHTYRK